MKLRPYQEECIAAVEEYWAANPRKNAAVSLPTGAGKTVIMADIARRAVERGERVAIIVNRDELVAQTIAKLRAADPLMMIGTVKAARNEFAAEVVVCSVQTLRRPGRSEKILPRDIVIYDEAHGSAAESSIDVMERLGAIGEGARAVGFSATFYRADGKPLDVVWDDVVYEKDILWAVTEGYLSDARGVSVPIRGLNLSEVKVSGADYQDKDLGQKMLDAHAAEQIARAYVENAAERKAICFSTTVDSATEITASLNAIGVSAETVTGKTPAGEYLCLAHGAFDGGNRPAHLAAGDGDLYREGILPLDCPKGHPLRRQAVERPGGIRAGEGQRGLPQKPASPLSHGHPPQAPPPAAAPPR